MRRLGALGPQVIKRLGQAMTKEEFPAPVCKSTCRQRVIRIDNPGIRILSGFLSGFFSSGYKIDSLNGQIGSYMRCMRTMNALYIDISITR